MTRSKIQKMKFFVFLLIFLLAQTAICDGSFREKRDVTAEDKKKVALVNEINKGVHEPSVRVKQKVAELSSDAKKPATDGNKTQDNITSKSSSDVTVNRTHIVDNEQPSEDHTTFNTGALVRGFLVFVGLSILVMAYIVFRSFRLSKTRAQLVRKYGVLTHRQDVEMRPLPLEEEDDEDTTVFDASNVVTTNIQHQNA